MVEESFPNHLQKKPTFLLRLVTYLTGDTILFLFSELLKELNFLCKLSFMLWKEHSCESSQH